jgi:hypothetical protein
MIVHAAPETAPTRERWILERISTIGLIQKRLNSAALVMG